MPVPPTAPTPLPPVAPPFPVTAPHRVVPAPRPVAGSPQVELDDAWPTALLRRVERLQGDPDGVLVGLGGDPALTADPGLHAAVEAAWQLLPGGAGALPRLGVAVSGGVARRTGPSVSEAATCLLLERTGVELLVVGWLLACSDDLVVLHRVGQGVLRAELLAVAFPSGWPPRLRWGASLLELHAPIADGERLQRAAPALSEAMLTKGPLRQHVWGLDPDGRLDRDPSDPSATSGPGPADPAAWWLRVERQTSVPLPRLGRALFTIRPFLVPLPALTREQRTTLAAALDSLSVEAAAYKGLAGRVEDLTAWLRGPDQFKVGSAG